MLETPNLTNRGERNAGLKSSTVIGIFSIEAEILSAKSLKIIIAISNWGGGKIDEIPELSFAMILAPKLNLDARAINIAAINIERLA